MKNRIAGSLIALLLGMGSALAATPDIQGTWKLSAPQSELKPVSGEPLPFTAEGRAQYEENKASAAKGDYEFDLTQSRCSTPGMPRIMLTPKRILILQNPGMIAMHFEWNHLFRQIDVSGKSLKPKEFGSMMGQSTGRWDGDTLVVETRGFTFQKLLDSYIPGSEQLELTERIRLKNRNTLEDRITIKDPQIFTKPWEVVLTYQRQPDDLLPEDVCLYRKAAGEMPLPK